MQLLPKLSHDEKMVIWLKNQSDVVKNLTQEQINSVAYILGYSVDDGCFTPEILVAAYEKMAEVYVATIKRRESFK